MQRGGRPEERSRLSGGQDTLAMKPEKQAELCDSSENADVLEQYDQTA